MASVFELLRDRLARLARADGLDDAPLTVGTAPDRWPGMGCLPAPTGRFVLRAGFGGAEGLALSPLVARFQGRLGEFLDLPLETPADRARFCAVLNAVLTLRGDITPEPLLCSTVGTEGCARILLERVRAAERQCPCVCLTSGHRCLYEALVEETPVLLLSEGDAGAPGAVGTAPVPEAVRRCALILVGGSALTHGLWDRIAPELEESAGILAYGITTAGAAALLGWPHHCRPSQPGDSAPLASPFPRVL